MDQQADSPFDRLSPRMRDCLRLAYERKTNKEIALIRGLSEGTVKGYIAEAIRLLGARGKVHAAELLHQHELGDPSRMEGAFRGVPEDTADEATAPQPEPPWWRSLPLRRMGASSNDLSVRQRLVWILIIAIAIVLGVSAIANVLSVIDRHVRR